MMVNELCEIQVMLCEEIKLLLADWSVHELEF